MRPTLYYKPGCPFCRWMSALARAISLFQVRRVPLTGVEARELYERYPEHRGQLMLTDGERVWFQRAVLTAIPGVLLSRVWSRIWRAGGSARQ